MMIDVKPERRLQLQSHVRKREIRSMVIVFDVYDQVRRRLYRACRENRLHKHDDTRQAQQMRITILPAKQQRSKSDDMSPFEQFVALQHAFPALEANIDIPSSSQAPSP